MKRTFLTRQNVEVDAGTLCTQGVDQTPTSRVWRTFQPRHLVGINRNHKSVVVSPVHLQLDVMLPHRYGKVD
jgi:hypothetical protein